jgi:hypothetical protein
LQVDDLSNNNPVAQRTVRLANVRNGLRRLTLRYERDNKEFPLAILLVDIQVLTMDDVLGKIRKVEESIEVGTARTHSPIYYLLLEGDLRAKISRPEPLSDSAK